MIVVDQELASLGLTPSRCDWSSTYGIHEPGTVKTWRTTVHRFVGSYQDVADLLRWAAATGVVLGDVEVSDCVRTISPVE